ncbi:PilZ domain-containing protein [Alkalicoccus urumqiensis]|uniref:PilZ domain-containing protein n=1 Tax=Alkalicoccus urumqiensis TaxID=1548213 RepID=A0A2P6MK29_ALKUR|nr:PilZ domain-containing protein [Alkalicoccus urumqiensis]PRO66652.1 hypothetical protein C6I21_04735 [Alkalicoccus urumqiensis]
MPNRRRQEAFRYEFGTPHDTSFYISRLKGKEHHSKNGRGVLMNMSPGGLRLQTELDLPEKDCELTFDMTIAGTQLEPAGVIVWKKQVAGRWLYGVDFLEDTETGSILFALKQFAREQSS